MAFSFLERRFRIARKTPPATMTNKGQTTPANRTATTMSEKESPGAFPNPIKVVLKQL